MEAEHDVPRQVSKDHTQKSFLGPDDCFQNSFRAVYLALMMLVSLAALDATVVSVAVPTMITDLGGAKCVM